MKILSIRIRNLASLEGDTEIDFNSAPLSTAGIFAITGPTGSGKSTILDALCLALYGCTPRYNHAENSVKIQDIAGEAIQQNDVRGILRDGTGEGFAEVDFVGIDSQTYRVRWNVGRAFNRPDRALQKKSSTLRCLTTQTDIPLSKRDHEKEMERLLGLNFDQFTRSVLLAQGDFTAFLKANNDEKASLLEKLTGTDIYTKLSTHVFESHRAQAEILNGLNLRKNAIQVLADEERARMDDRVVALDNELPLLQTTVDQIDLQLQWHILWQSLQQRAKESDAAAQTAASALEAAADRTKILATIKSVQDIRPVVDGVDRTALSIQNVEREIKERTQEVEALTEKQKDDEIAVSNAEQILLDKTSAQTDAKPLLDEAKQLDVKLEEKESQSKLAEEEATTAASKRQAHVQAIQLTTAQKDAVEKREVDLNNWFRGNETRKLVAEEHTYILSRLQTAEGWLKQLKDVDEKLGNGEKLLVNLNGDSNSLKEKLEEQRTTLSHVVESVKKLEEDLQLMPVTEWRAQLTLIGQEINEFIQYEPKWILLSAACEEKERLEKTLNELSAQQQAEEKEWKNVETELPLLAAQRDMAHRLWEKSMLTVGENVESLRAALEDDQPCPVCGATDHPYADQAPQVRTLLEGLEKAYRDTEADYSAASNRSAALKISCDDRANRIGAQKGALSDNNNRLVELQSSWQSFSFLALAEQMKPEERSQWFRDQRESRKNTVETLKVQITRAEQLDKDILDARAVNVKITLDIGKLEGEITKIQSKIQTASDRASDYHGQQTSLKTGLDELKLELQPRFGTDEWFQKWREGPESFQSKLLAFATEWQEKATERLKAHQELRTLEERLLGLQNLSKGIQDELDLKEGKRDTLRNDTDKLRQTRNTLFKGVNVAVVEKELTDAVQMANDILVQCKKNFQSISNQITNLSGGLVQFDAQLIVLKREANGFDGKLQQWLADYHQRSGLLLTEVQLRKYLQLGAEWIRSEEQTLRLLEDAVTRSKSLWEQAVSAVGDHEKRRTDGRSMEELTALVEEAKRRLEEANIERVGLTFQLDADKQRRETAGALLNQIGQQELVVGQWARLNEVIGSADGKKFRQIAQEFTLDVLLGYANVQLKMLSNRYVLDRIPDTLGIQVRDQDMGDEVRTVYAISGGESFLVSLALALGLASLSSNQMNVESLFIDEGFGSLDPDTLNIAMDALERLHSQGRKVGVISHVQEMTERIPVQIRVSRRQSGKSSVEVIRQ